MEKMSATEFTMLRKKILEVDPSVKFQKKYPWHALFGIALMAVIGGIIALNLQVASTGNELDWPVKLASSLILGIAFSSLAFFNHELLHGSMVKSMTLMRILAYPGFFILAMSPELWRVWHNQLHHFNTNQTGGADPDLAGDWGRLKERKIGRFVVKLLPGGTIFSVLFSCVAFSLQCVNVAWVRSLERPKLYAGMSRLRVNLETFSYYAMWAAIAVLLPFQQFFYLFLIPLFITNAVIINFVGVPHNMRPLSMENQPLLTAISLKSPGWVNGLTFNFSFHCEHHIFPEANHRYLPQIHEVLKKSYPNDYKYVPYLTALRALYTTPRAYFDDNHLFNPDTGEKVNLHELARTRFS